MRLTTLSSLAGAALALSVGASQAATTLYDEAADGDLDAIGSTNLDLVEGANEIMGSIQETGVVSDTDRVRFTQSAGMNVNSIVLSFAAPFDNFNIGQSLSAALFNSVANLFDDSFNMITSGSSITASFNDSFGPETGPLSQNTAGAIWDFQLSPGSVAPAQPWTLTINTTLTPVDPVDPPIDPGDPPIDPGDPAPVPLPAGGWLLLSGLAGVAALKRRKKKVA